MARSQNESALLSRRRQCEAQEREFFIDNLLVRIHFIIVMIRWTGLASGYFVNFRFQNSTVPQYCKIDLEFGFVKESTGKGGPGLGPFLTKSPQLIRLSILKKTDS